MVDEVEFSGKTVEDAIGQAEEHFGVSRTQLNVQIQNQASRGVFGFGAEPARVRVARLEIAPAPIAEPAPTTPTPIEPPDEAELSLVDAAHGDFDNDQDDEHDEDDEFAGETTAAATKGAALPSEARQVLADLLASMGFDVEVTVRSEAEPVILAVSGENLGVLIGRRGDNLASLQFMTNLILSKGRRQWPRVVIDVENYRARREESLRSLADRIAYRVSRGGRPFTLEAMPASDRRIIHLSLRERPDIETYSIGEGASRRVVIARAQGSTPRDERDEADDYEE